MKRILIVLYIAFATLTLPLTIGASEKSLLHSNTDENAPLRKQRLYNIVCEGDSLMDGFPLWEHESMPYKLNTLLQMRSDGNIYKVKNIGYPQRLMTEMNARYATAIAPLYDPTADKNVLILCGGGERCSFRLRQKSCNFRV